MEYKGDEQPTLNDTGQPHSLEQGTVPASLLPSVLSRLGLGDMTSLSFTGVDTQLAALKDAEIPVRVTAVRILGEHTEACTIGPLVTALHDSAWEVRAAAVWALGKFGEQVPLEALMRATNDEDSSVRAAALRTLELLGDRVSIEPLMRALGDSDWQVREVATLTLGELGEQAPLDPSLARLNDEHTAVRDAARLALEESHPEALSAISIESSMITQGSDRNTVSGMREQEHPWPGVEVEARSKASSHGDSTLIQLTSYARRLLSRVVRDVIVLPLTGMRSTSTDEELSDVIVSEPGEMETLPQTIQIRPRRLRHIAEGVLAALIIAGLVASWLAIEHRLHPSQGSSFAILMYHGSMDGPAVWSSDSKYLTILANASSSGENVLVWNRDTGQMTTHVLRALGVHPQENRTVFAPDGKHFAFVERVTINKVAVQVWDAIAWRSVLTTYYSAPSGILDVVWSPDSVRIVITGEDGAVQVWNVVTGRELATCHVPLLNYLPAVYMSPDGHRVIIGYGRQNTYVLDLTTCKLLTLPSSDSNFTVWSPQGNRFATISFTVASVVQVWDAHTGRNLANFNLSAPVSDTGLVWTPDGTRIVAWGYKEVDVLDIATQRIVLKVVPTRIDLLPVWALSPDGGHIASLSAADAVQIWDAITGRKLNAYQSPGNSVKVVAWSPDSRTIAAGSTNGTVRVWYADRASQTYHSDSSAVLNITWSPDGGSIATGNLDGGIWVWKVN